MIRLISDEVTIVAKDKDGNPIEISLQKLIDDIETIPGPKGEDGKTGPQGIQGNPGQNGTKIISGEAFPTSGMITGDHFIIYGTWDLYRYSGSTWIKIGNIHGAGGNTTWYDGTSVPNNTLGLDGDYYLRSSTLDVYRKANGIWTHLFIMQGSIWHFGTGEPISTLGKLTDIYTDTGTYRVYKKISDTQWQFSFSQAGQNSQNFLSGTANPTINTGKDGDHYLVTTAGGQTNYLYKKENGSWQLLADLRGLKGTDGLNGTSIKRAIINEVGHLIITLTNDTVIDAGDATGGVDGIGIKTITTDVSGNLIITLTDNQVINAGKVKGETGDTGSIILNGNGIPSNSLGRNNDYYINKETDDWYYKSSNSWGNPLINLRGISGDRRIWSFNEKPLDSFGSNGDIAFVYSLYTIFEKVNNIWIVKATFQGQKGDTVWLWGNSMPDNDVGFNGYFHINLITGDISIKINDKWSIQGNIKGTKGEGFKYYFTTDILDKDLNTNVNINYSTLTPTVSQGTIRVGDIIQDRTGKQASVITAYVTYINVKITGSIGSSDYIQLENLPSINNIPLIGNINIKTINGESILGLGDLFIAGSGGGNAFQLHEHGFGTVYLTRENFPDGIYFLSPKNDETAARFSFPIKDVISTIGTTTSSYEIPNNSIFIIFSPPNLTTERMMLHYSVVTSGTSAGALSSRKTYITDQSYFYLYYYDLIYKINTGVSSGGGTSSDIKMQDLIDHNNSLIAHDDIRKLIVSSISGFLEGGSI